MTHLNNDHIDYIIKDLLYRGIILENFQDEVVDHICSSVEKEMENGRRFIDAYHDVLKTFGHTSGLRQTQKQIANTKKSTDMLKSYLLIALRNHLKNRFYTLINITGLAVGIASCMIIMVFVLHELSYDRHYENAGRIFRVNTEIKVGVVHHHLALGSAALGELFVQNYPEVESTVRMLNWGHRFVGRAESPDRFRENVMWVDSTFFRIFDVPMLEGDSRTALVEPNTIAISRKMTEKYFPEGKALGKSLMLDDNVNYRVTAIYENFPDNSHFHFDMVRSMTALADAKNVSLLGGGEVNLYLLLKPGADPAALEAKFPSFVEKHVGPQLGSLMGADFTMEKFFKDGNAWRYWLTPLTDIHLYSDLNGEFEGNGSITYVYLFSCIALFILIVACINFMNLSTARSASRAKEVGIRKVMGSLRVHLMRQFLTESFLLTLTSIILAVGLAYLALPVFNQLALKNLSLPFTEISFYLVLLAAVLFVGIMAGLYPSFFLSSFRPINALKGKTSSGKKGRFVRSGLVVFQFMISIFLIVGTITVNRQLNYFQNKKLGFEKDQVVVVHEVDALNNQVQSFKDEVLQNSFIISGTISGYLPVSGTWRNFNTFWPEGKVPTGEDINSMVTLQQWQVDYDYLKTMGMKIKTGRYFSPEFLSDSTQSVVLNEAAVAKLEFGNSPLGKKISMFGAPKPDGTPDPANVKSWTVVGVVEDFHFESMRENIAPLAFFLDRSNGKIAFRFAGSDTPAVLAAIESSWKKMAPDRAFQYSFLDKDFGKMYDSEKRLATIFGVFAGLAIIIACLGLFGLTAFTAEQRSREIGIRKTLGASIDSIVFLLSKDYGKLVFISFLFSTPLAWYAVTRWLETYSYKAEIGAGVYLLAGATTLIVALLTMGYQCLKAASENPVTSLRNE